jgi:hypothetical protein
MSAMSHDINSSISAGVMQQGCQTTSNSREKNSSLQANSFSGTEDISEDSLPCYQQPPLFPILSETNQIHSPRPISVTSILILFSYLRLHVPSGLYPSGLSTNPCIHFSSLPCMLMHHPSHPP